MDAASRPLPDRVVLRQQRTFVELFDVDRVSFGKSSCVATPTRPRPGGMPWLSAIQPSQRAAELGLDTQQGSDVLTGAAQPGRDKPA
jgi:hypothetical protein